MVAQRARGGEAAALHAVEELMQLPMHSDILKASDCGYVKSERWMVVVAGLNKCAPCSHTNSN